MSSPPRKRHSADRFVTPVKTPRSPQKNSQSSDSKTNFLRHQFSSPNFSHGLSPSFRTSRSPSISSENLLGSPKSPKRYYPKKPLHIIPLNDIQSDFYVQPMDWSKTNDIAMALKTTLCFINPKNSAITFLRDSPAEVLAVKFNDDGTLLSLGDKFGKITIFDPMVLTKSYECHVLDTSILCSDWKSDAVLLGSRYGNFVLFDTGSRNVVINKQASLEEICSIKFAPDMIHFETTSNDCTVSIWDLRNMETPSFVFTKHTAAVKAVCWSPYDENIICTGGGTNDKNLYQWNINSGEVIKSQETGSQICNAYWNEEYNEIVTSHGYSCNHVALWKGSTLEPIVSYHSHKQRALFMSVSPDSTSVATASPDNTVQIWKFFSPPLKNACDLIR
jgi:cell division cycle 20-like protein 1 (cofactor of APC complex)